MSRICVVSYFYTWWIQCFVKVRRKKILLLSPLYNVALALGFRAIIVDASLGKSEPCGSEALSSELESVEPLTGIISRYACMSAFCCCAVGMDELFCLGRVMRFYLCVREKRKS